MKIFTVLSVGLVCLACSSYAVNFDDMLVSKRSTTTPLFGMHTNVKWISHTPDPNQEAVEGEAEDYCYMGAGRVRPLAQDRTI